MRSMFVNSFMGAVVLMLTMGTTPSARAQAPATDQDTEQGEPGSIPAAFDVPRLYALQAVEVSQAAGLIEVGKYEEAEAGLQLAVKRIPHDVGAFYQLARALAQQDKLDAAFEALQKAVTNGLRDAGQIRADPALVKLRDDPRFAETLKRAEKLAQDSSSPLPGWKYQIRPAIAENGEVVIEESCVAWSPQVQMFRAFVTFSEDIRKQPIAKGLGEVGERLRKWYAAGTAAGNAGDLYDNHDSDHSNMNFKSLPQLTRVEFSEKAKSKRLHHGLQRYFLYNAVTIGNSSTAYTSGPLWRSQARMALTQPNVPRQLYLHYRSNHLYFYPEHRDHDPGDNGADKKGYGDVFPANTPYLVISQGSSGSDRAFLNATGQTLAAFHPDVKTQLGRAGLLMPTLQMILRRSNKQVESDEDYLSGKAHPTVFEGDQIDALKMVEMAHEMTAEVLPPLAVLQVIEEDEFRVGVDYFDVKPSEKLFDTPCAVARVAKATTQSRRMVVSAEQSQDLHGSELSYHWVVLRGDAERVAIRPLNDTQSMVELTVSHHERRPVHPDTDLESSRVDIGLFVSNGTYYSPPAFVSFAFLDNEQRVYDEGGRIQVVDYADAGKKGNYVDPLLDARKDWRDEYRYDDAGKLLGWTRVRGDEKEEFTADGELLVEQDGEKLPMAVKYRIEKRGQQRFLVQELLVR